MPALCLFEDKGVDHLAPLTLTRAAFDLRVGARTIAETVVQTIRPRVVSAWVRQPVADVTREYFPDWTVNSPQQGATIFVNARWVMRPGAALSAIEAAMRGRELRAVVQGGTLLALWHPDPPPSLFRALTHGVEAVPDALSHVVTGAAVIDRPWSLMDDIEDRITFDLGVLGGLGLSDGADVQQGAQLVDAERIHIGEGAEIRPGAVLNATSGPIHVGARTIVGENAVLRGPVFLGERCVVKPAARIDGSAFGPSCKLGGEIHASVMHGHSSKSHDGYLGNSIVGQWCNLGADTNTSNLKNDYGEVTMFDAVAQAFEPTGRQFAGLVMGDHSKCSINSMFNTGSVVGVFANVFGSGFPPRHIPSFSWGGAGGLEPYRIEKALRVAEAVLARRGCTLGSAEREVLEGIAGSR